MPSVALAREDRESLTHCPQEKDDFIFWSPCKQTTSKQAKRTEGLWNNGDWSKQINISKHVLFRDFRLCHEPFELLGRVRSQWNSPRPITLQWDTVRFGCLRINAKFVAIPDIDFIPRY